MYPTIHILSLPISMYGLLAFIGMLAAVWYCMQQAKRRHLAGDDMLNLIIYALLFAALGAKLLYLLPRIGEMWEYRTLIFGSWQNFSDYMMSGFVFYGGLIGAFIGCIIYSRQFRISILPYLRAALPAIALFHALGRIGCYLGGCCYGIEMAPPLGMLYHSVWTTGEAVHRFPVQLVEAACNLVFFVMLHRLVHKQSFGMQIGTYLFMYGTVRFFLEFLRGDALRGVFILSTSQWIALLLMPLAWYCYYTSDAKNVLLHNIEYPTKKKNVEYFEK